MDDPGGVGSDKATGYLNGNPQSLRHGQRPPSQTLPKALSVQVLHGDPRAPLGILAEVVERDDAWMIDSGSGLRLLQETPTALGIGYHLGAQEFDGDCSAKPRVARPVDFTHPTRAKRGDNLVGTEASSWGQRHGRIWEAGRRVLS
jgi:hypothetical protein